jgi:hypothetical protein
MSEPETRARTPPPRPELREMQIRKALGVTPHHRHHTPLRWRVRVVYDGREHVSNERQCAVQYLRKN